MKSDSLVLGLADVLGACNKKTQREIAKTEASGGPEYSCQSGTTRVIRVYRYTGSGIELMHRIDWEFPVPGEPLGRAAWIDDDDCFKDRAPGGAGEVSKWVERLKQCRKLDALVIHDAGKGVVSKPLIEWLIERKALDEDTKCYVLSRTWMPDWLRTLKQLDVRLVFVHWTAGRGALEQGAIGSWLYRPKEIRTKAHLCRETILAVDKLVTEVRNKGPDPSVVVQVKDWALIAVEGVASTEWPISRWRTIRLTSWWNLPWVP